MKWMFPQVLALALLAGCSSRDFVPTERVLVRPRYAVEPQVVDGVPFYQGGGPNRPYRVLGYAKGYWIKPYLHERDLLGVARTVREAGGKAGVVVRGPGVLPGNPPRYPRENHEFALRVQLIE